VRRSCCLVALALRPAYSWSLYVRVAPRGPSSDARAAAVAASLATEAVLRLLSLRFSALTEGSLRLPRQRRLARQFVQILLDVLGLVRNLRSTHAPLPPSATFFMRRAAPHGAW
jgi:hypothetical protein